MKALRETKVAFADSTLFAVFYITYRCIWQREDGIKRTTLHRD